MDERLMVAMRVARQHHLSYWDAALQEHKRHPTFRMHGWPYTLEYGFTCQCSGEEREWRVKIQALKEMLPEARESVIRMYRHHSTKGAKAERRQRAKAETRAKALLHRFLTREQRLELRKTRGFTMRGKDGRAYYVTLGSASNIYVEHEGVKYRLCVVPKDWSLPTYDVLLAQKIMLETEPEAFLRLAKAARVEPVTTKAHIYETYESAAFLLGETVEVRKPLEVIAIPNEVLENPREWVETRCRD